MLQLGIIGLPQSGKTSLFNALSGSHAAVGDYSTAKSANIAMVEVPDKRVERLAEIFKPKKITFAEIEFIDIAGMTKDASSDRKKEASYIHSIKQADALIQVIRSFENPNVPHPDGSVDSKRDVNEIDSELILADLIMVENRIAKIRHNLKVAKNPQNEVELTVLEKCHQTLNGERPLRTISLAPDELKTIGGFRFLTLKPMLYILNLDENQLPEWAKWEAQFEHLTKTPNSALAHICAPLQMDIALLPDDEKSEFMKELGIEELASDTIIKKSFDLLGMIAFLTGGDPEVHSWPLKRGCNAHQAAGEIHSDIERGFIRAEVVAFADLDRLGSWAKARDEGKMHLHGKDYIVLDGDVILFRFNV